MANTYTWSFPEFDCVSQDGLTDVVLIVHWRLTATDDAGNTVAEYDTQAVAAADPSSFTPYGNLTAEIVTGWMSALLPVDDIKTLLDGRLAAIASPAVTPMAPPF